MKGLTVLLGGSLGGGLGWWVGRPGGLWLSFGFGILGTAVGTYLTRRLWDDYLP